jgi:hypothetical protein
VGTNGEAILIGGPRDGTSFHPEDAALVELEIDGLIHRYIRTGAQREHDGQSLTVYNYDGVVAPQGGQSGVENAQQRVASPLADATGTESR